MSFDGIQVESAGMDVSRHPKKERQVSLGGDPAHTVHEADAGTISPTADTSQDAPRVAGEDERDELPAGNSDLSRIDLVAPMILSGLDARMLGKAPQPPSTLDCTAEARQS